MELKQTHKYLEKLRADLDLDTYAVFVRCGAHKATLLSENADEFTYFDVASMGKVLVTSTLTLQSIDRGLLSLENTLGEFFDVADSQKAAITIRQLLTHTSGIIRHELTRETCRKGTDAIAAEILSYPLEYEPDTNYIYSCNGYILLSFILEKCHKRPLEELYRDWIAAPLCLKRTAFEIALDEPNAAVCYFWRNGAEAQRFDDRNVLAMGRAVGSGGQQSCLHDIEKFTEAIHEKSELLYSKPLFALAEENYTPHYAEGRGLGYLVVDASYPQTGKLFPIGSFGHCGHTGQSFFINREAKLSVIILTNATRHAKLKKAKGYYDDVMRMREELHNTIREDLIKEGMINE